MRSVIVLLCCSFSFGLTALAQTDQEHLDHAQNALTMVGSCDDALRFLEQVSPEGKTRPPYFLAMARANDCKANNEQAIYYYGKYLEYRPANDSVRKRMAELKDTKKQDIRAANEQRVARMQAEELMPHKKKKNKRPTLEDAYISVGLGYVAPLGGDDAPYKSGIDLNLYYGFPIINNHAVIEVGFNSDLMFSANQSWYARACMLTPADVASASPGLGFTENVQLGLQAVVINNSKLALTVGPAVAIGYSSIATLNSGYDIYMPEPEHIFNIYYGVRSTLHLGESVLFGLEYSWCGNNNARTDVGSYVNSIPVDLSVLRISCSYKFNSWW